MTASTSNDTKKQKPKRKLKSLRPDGAGQVITLEKPIALDCGQVLESVEVAYETYGTLNLAKSNAILVCHALTGDQFVASNHPITGKLGWWADLIGPDKIIDTNRFYVICANVLGGCMGTTGPASLNPATGEAYGLDLPIITVGDMVKSQAGLIEALGIDTLLAVIGGSMGGMQVLEWVARYPEKVFAAAPIATASRQSPQNIAFHEIGRQAIMADPHWSDGVYHNKRKLPTKGLSVARMTAHVTYLSEDALDRKFGRRLQDREKASFSFDADFQIESYLRHQGLSFVDRFDANSYLYITRAMDYFDMAADKPLTEVLRETTARFLCCSFSSDWLYPTEENKKIVRALHGAGADVSFVEIKSDKGHDAFLLEEPEFHDVMQGFIKSIARDRGVK